MTKETFPFIRTALAALIIIVLAIAFCSCAHTDFYRDGRLVAHFEGDMTAMTYSSAADGRIEWAGGINHSAATLAQGKAGSEKISAIGAGIAVSGVTAILHH